MKARAEETSTTTCLQFGVIGAGCWRPHLIRNISEIPGAQVRAVADLSTERLQALRLRYPATHLTQDYAFVSKGDQPEQLLGALYACYGGGE